MAINIASKEAPGVTLGLVGIVSCIGAHAGCYKWLYD